MNSPACSYPSIFPFSAHHLRSAKQVLWLLVVGIGTGFLFQPPLIALQAAMPLDAMATSTATFGLVRTLGGTIGISIGDAILGSQLRKRLSRISGYSPSTGGGLTNDVRSLSRLEVSALIVLLATCILINLQPPELRAQVYDAYMKSLSTIWFVADD
jgi:hypothetical protein